MSEIPHILEDICPEAADLPGHSTLVKWFDRIKTALWRVPPCLSAQEHEPSGQAAIDATFFDRKNASKHYCRRTNDRVQTFKTTAFVDTKSHVILNAYCTAENATTHSSAGQVARVAAGDLNTLAVNKEYDWMQLHEKLREEGVRPLTKHRESRPIVPRVVHMMDEAGHRHQAMCEAVFSMIKCTLDDAMRARSRCNAFRELVLMCVVRNIKRSVKQ